MFQCFSSSVDLLTSRAQSFVFLLLFSEARFRRREKKNTERAERPPPEPEMRSRGLLRKSIQWPRLNKNLGTNYFFQLALN